MRRFDRPDIALEAKAIFDNAIEAAGGTHFGVTQIGGGMEVTEEPGQVPYLRLVQNE